MATVIALNPATPARSRRARLRRLALRWGVGLSVALSVALTACTSAPPLAPADADQKAKAFKPGAGKAAIYVYRLDGWRGSAVRYPVSVDGASLGAVANGQYFVMEVDPGDHEVWVGWDQTMRRTANDPINAKLVLVQVQATAGGVYFVRADQKGQDHVAVSEDEGKRELLACCQRAADPRQGGRPLFR